MAKVSVKSAARQAKSQEAKATHDSFQNFAQGLGIGTDNLSTGNTYGFNPVSRERTRLEWAYRGSWIAGIAIDTIANDMTRAGVELKTELAPDDVDQIHERATTLGIWSKINQTIKWGRLYGGCICVLLISGQETSTPLRMDTVGPDQFKGLLVLDRWQVMPSLDDLVTELGPDLGLPKFYTVMESAPALRGKKIHYSRILRMIGDELPYWQSVAENLWGMSVLERPFDRMTAFDAATTGASQLVAKSYLRYFKVKDYRKLVATGGPAYRGLQQMVQAMRLFASNEGISLIDAEDDLVTTQASAFPGIAECLLQIAQQISGAFQIPLVRLLGQSPAGLNSSGDSDLRTYYDGIRQHQVMRLLVMVTRIYRCIAQSLKLNVGDGFTLDFRPLWQLDEVGKADVALKLTQTILSGKEAGVVTDQTTLKELNATSKLTGVWGNISDEEIEDADDVLAPPVPEMGEVKPGASGGRTAVSEEQVLRQEGREEKEAAA